MENKEVSSLAEVFQSPYCNECESLTELTRVYTCNTCGIDSDDRRCEQCNRFMSRRDEDGCETCFSSNVEPVDTIVDHDGKTIMARDYEPDGEAYSVRLVAIEADHKVKREAQVAAEAQKAYEGGVLTRWDQVAVGDVLLRAGFDKEVNTFHPPIVLDILTPGDNPMEGVNPGAIYATINQYGTETESHDPSDQVYVMKNPQIGKRAELIRPLNERIKEKVDVELSSYGNSISLIEVRRDMTSFRDNRFGQIPVGQILGRSSEYSNMYVPVCAFTNPKDARHFAVLTRKMSSDLRTKDGVLASDPVEAKLVERIGWTDPTPDWNIDFTLGCDRYGKEEWLIKITSLDNSNRQRYSVSFTDPAVLDAVADGADLIAEWISEQLGLTQG